MHWTTGQLDVRSIGDHGSRMAGFPGWIAVVDDDAAVLRALVRLLRAYGFEVRAFASAGEFLAAIPQGTPACLILDLYMPGVSGLELHQRLRCEGIHLPTVFITAQDDVGVRLRCEADSDTSFLLKPLQEVSLVSAIERAVQRRKA